MVHTLNTKRLHLRRASESDLVSLHVILSDAETMRYWSTPPHADIDTTREWLESMLSSSTEKSDEFVFEHEGELIGKVGCYRLPEFGLIMRRDKWGSGLMLEAATAVIEHLFNTHHALDALHADVDPRNAASLRLLTRVGFVETSRKENTYCIDGVYTDSVYLALRRST